MGITFLPAGQPAGLTLNKTTPSFAQPAGIQPAPQSGTDKLELRFGSTEEKHSQKLRAILQALQDLDANNETLVADGKKGMTVELAGELFRLTPNDKDGFRLESLKQFTEECFQAVEYPRGYLMRRAAGRDIHVNETTRQVPKIVVTYDPVTPDGPVVRMIRSKKEEVRQIDKLTARSEVQLRLVNNLPSRAEYLGVVQLPHVTMKADLRNFITRLPGLMEVAKANRKALGKKEFENFLMKLSQVRPEDVKKFQKLRPFPEPVKLMAVFPLEGQDYEVIYASHSDNREEPTIIIRPHRLYGYPSSLASRVMDDPGQFLEVKRAATYETPYLSYASRKEGEDPLQYHVFLGQHGGVEALRRYNEAVTKLREAGQAVITDEVRRAFQIDNEIHWPEPIK